MSVAAGIRLLGLRNDSPAVSLNHSLFLLIRKLLQVVFDQLSTSLPPEEEVRNVVVDGNGGICL